MMIIKTIKVTLAMLIMFMAFYDSFMPHSKRRLQMPEIMVAMVLITHFRTNRLSSHKCNVFPSHLNGNTKLLHQAPCHGTDSSHMIYSLTQATKKSKNLSVHYVITSQVSRILKIEVILVIIKLILKL